MMGYDELFSSIECKRVIIIEDDFKQGEYRKERFLYDITRMDIGDRDDYLSEIELLHPETEKAIRGFLGLADTAFDNIGKWDDVIPKGDISVFFSIADRINADTKQEMHEKYDALDNAKLQEVYGAGKKYGVGVDHPAYFDSLYDEYVFQENRAKSIRIYTEFSAEIQQLFENDIELATDSRSVVCIIDNYLDGANRAQEVLDVISQKSKTERKNIVGSIFSSRTEFESVNDILYFEYTSKETPEHLKSSIAKSAYNYFISKLKKETLSGLEKAFDNAISNKSIAFYLSKMALKEGMSEYRVITDWIKLMSITQEQDSSSIKQLIALSKVINLLGDIDELPDTSLKALNTFEAFDYTPNDYYLPASPGDVFVDSNGKWFVLIGQDCDMARSNSRTPKNAIAELLPAQIRNQTSFDKWTNDLKKASIYSFRKSIDDEPKVLQIDYTRRHYISNEIINLCAYDKNGRCMISLSKPLNRDITMLMQGYVIEYYKNLQEYFSAIKRLKETAAEDFGCILAKEHSPRLISVQNYKMDDESLDFGLRRVCRLTHSYVFYLYKLYLEYRGRQPFQTINLIRQEDLSLPIKHEGAAQEMFINVVCVPIPDKSNRKEWCWIIEKNELNDIVRSLYNASIIEPSEEILIETSAKEIQLSNNKNLTMIKHRDIIEFLIS